MMKQLEQAETTTQLKGNVMVLFPANEGTDATIQWKWIHFMTWSIFAIVRRVFVQTPTVASQMINQMCCSLVSRDYTVRDKGEHTSTKDGDNGDKYDDDDSFLFMLRQKQHAAVTTKHSRYNYAAEKCTFLLMKTTHVP